MKRKALMYKTEEQECIIKLSSRCDKLGNILFFVTYGENQADYVVFSHLSSALDFINSNFKADV